MKKTFKIGGSIFIVLSTLIIVSGFKFYNDWYLCQNENFTVMFPIKPTEEIKVMTTNNGEITIKTYFSKAQNNADSNLKYYVSVNPVPNQKVEELTEKEKFFTAAIKGSLRNHKAELIFDKIIKYDGASGHFVKMKMNDGKIILNMKIFLKNSKYYGAIVYTSKEKEDNTDITRFFDSFKINN